MAPMPFPDDATQTVNPKSAITRFISLPGLSPGQGFLFEHMTNPGEIWSSRKPAVDHAYLKFAELTKSPELYKLLSTFDAKVPYVEDPDLRILIFNIGTSDFDIKKKTTT